MDDGARVITGYWTLLVMMDEPRMPDDFFMFINASRTFINSQPLLAQWKDAWDDRFETIIGRCRITPIVSPPFNFN